MQTGPNRSRLDVGTDGQADAQTHAKFILHILTCHMGVLCLHSLVVSSALPLPLLPLLVWVGTDSGLPHVPLQDSGRRAAEGDHRVYVLCSVRGVN